MSAPQTPDPEPGAWWLTESLEELCERLDRSSGQWDVRRCGAEALRVIPGGAG